MNALWRVWDHFEEGFIAFLLAAMTLVTFVYVILNNLYKLTPMQSTFSANMLALVDGSPRVFNLKQALQQRPHNKRIYDRIDLIKDESRFPALHQ